MAYNKIYFRVIITILLLVFGINLHAEERKHENLAQNIASVVKPSAPKEIFQSEDSNLLLFESDEEADAPASDLYQIWTNQDVNPYKVAIKDIEDSILINLWGYIHPVDNLGHITSEYGPRRGRFHHGIDLKVLTGDDIYAAFSGKVRVIGFDRYGYGHYVVLRHENGFETVYGHLSKVRVTENQDVEAGDLIGLGGNTGRSTGSHLHFEIRYLGNAINPRQIIDFESRTTSQEHYILCKETSFKELADYIQTAGQAKYHVIRSGDSLSKIAVRYGVSVKKLCQLNGITTKTVLIPKRRIRYN